MAMALTRLLYEDFVARGTRNDERMNDEEVVLAVKAHRAVLERLGLEPPQLPFLHHSGFFVCWWYTGSTRDDQRKRVMRRLWGGGRAGNGPDLVCPQGRGEGTERCAGAWVGPVGWRRFDRWASRPGTVGWPVPGDQRGWGLQ
ncbi:hypothetical protein ACFV19_11435 [Streptomyces griseoluteus]|uniref:hypothetical protein n=1 Tax=Streptomyces griseoluteus TaxID=29306 RepID=UPI003699059E